MPYTVSYSPEERKKYPLPSDLRNKRWASIVAVGILLALAILFISPIGKEARSSLQTDSMRIADEAAAVFAEQLSTGKTVYDALQSYCNYILGNANG